MFGINKPNSIASRQVLAMASVGIAALLIFDIVPAASAQLAGTTSGLGIQQSQEGGSRLTLLGAVGVSLVKGVQVTGAMLDKQSNQVTVTLMSSPSANATTNTTAPAVTAMAIRTQSDLTGLLQSMMTGMQSNQMAMGTTKAMQQGAMGNTMGTMITPGGSMLSTNATSTSMLNIKSFIDRLQIGSAITQRGWSSPHQITIPIIDGSNNTNIVGGNIGMMMGPAASSSSVSDTNIVIVLVVPYTGGTQIQGAVTTTVPSSSGG